MSKDSVGLTDFKIPLQKIAPQKVFQNREGLELSYRFYSSWSDHLLIFYHGIGGDSRYICSLASYLAENNIASVLTPDLRGHGKSRQETAKVSGPEALLNDLQDLVQKILQEFPGKELLIGGHSLGGGLALKALTHPNLASYFHEAVVVSPYLHFAAFGESGLRFNSWLKYSESSYKISLQMPEGYKSGSEVLHYDLSFFEAASLSSLKDLDRLPPSLKIHLVASSGDQLSPAAKYQQILGERKFAWTILEGFSHMGVVMAPGALQVIAGLLG